MARMTPSEALVETLVDEEVKVVFGIVGSAYMDALDLFPEQGSGSFPSHTSRRRPTPRTGSRGSRAGPRSASVRTAPAWPTSFRLSPPPTGPLPGGGHHAGDRVHGDRTGGFQELDQMPWFQACTKYQVRVNRPERMAELARNCFYVAKAECRPTQLNIPRDYFYGDIECETYKTPDPSNGAGAETNWNGPPACSQRRPIP